MAMWRILYMGVLVARCLDIPQASIASACLSSAKPAMRSILDLEMARSSALHARIDRRIDRGMQIAGIFDRSRRRHVRRRAHILFDRVRRRQRRLDDIAAELIERTVELVLRHARARK